MIREEMKRTTLSEKKSQGADQEKYGADVPNSEDEVLKRDSWAGGDNVSSTVDWEKTVSKKPKKSKKPTWASGDSLESSQDWMKVGSISELLQMEECPAGMAAEPAAPAEVPSLSMHAVDGAAVGEEMPCPVKTAGMIRDAGASDGDILEWVRTLLEQLTTAVSVGPSEQEEFSFTGDVGELPGDEAFGVGYEAGQRGLE